MKKSSSVMLFTLIFLVVLLPFRVNANQPNIVDQAEVFTSDEYIDLLQQADSLSYHFRIDAVIVTIDTLNGRNIQAAADDFYDDPANGYGPDGVLLLYAVEDREIAISTAGECIYMLNDRRLDTLLDRLVDYLRDGEVYEGMADYLGRLYTYCDGYTPGEYDNPENSTFSPVVRIFVALIIGMISAFITISVMKSKMHTARLKNDAADYITPGTYNLYECQDFFLYSHTSKTRRETENRSSTHTGSSGRSHGGGSRHF